MITTDPHRRVPMKEERGLTQRAIHLVVTSCFRQKPRQNWADECPQGPAHATDQHGPRMPALGTEDSGRLEFHLIHSI